MILIEQTVEVYQGTEVIVKYFFENNRYHIEGIYEDSTLTLSSYDKNRLLVKYKKGQIFENVEIRIFVPQWFETIGEHQWALKPKEIEDEG